MAKLDIDFILIDESVVMHGFRALMSGSDLGDFKKNPVLSVQHKRPSSDGTSENVYLPIGMWYEIRVEGDKLLAKPDFDDEDELAVKVQKKVKAGYMKGASVWIEPAKLSDDPADMLPGQTLPTFTKWGLLEASIVDIPNCRNSLAITTSAGKKIILNAGSDNVDLKEYLENFSPKDKKNTMDKKLLCAKLGLDESATDAQISEKLSATLTNANAHTQLTAQNTQLASENTTLKDEVLRLKTEADEKKITDLVDDAITGKKLMAGDRELYITLASKDFETTSKLIGQMKAYESIESKLSGPASETDKLELADLMKLTGNQLYHEGKLERLQALSPEHFKLKYKEAFGVEFKVVKP